MARPQKLDQAVIDAWLSRHEGWERTEQGAVAKRYSFPDFAAAVAFAVRLACLAEKRDHHPDLEIGWGRARVRWSTHDAGGITQLDLDAAEASDSIAP